MDNWSSSKRGEGEPPLRPTIDIIIIITHQSSPDTRGFSEAVANRPNAEDTSIDATYYYIIGLDIIVVVVVVVVAHVTVSIVVGEKNPSAMPRFQGCFISIRRVMMVDESGQAFPSCIDIIIIIREARAEKSSFVQLRHRPFFPFLGLRLSVSLSRVLFVHVETTTAAAAAAAAPPPTKRLLL
ncbi:uncharacterized protein K489DRAFT_384230 [Dissoconium aciculare CBS 342.82]|uniref:Uncharacterized protein n=1 Tax=Dissoconium aciculare CBS 342.82 TaxID=1314786 RepID=A0A6J3LU44_9PEZI|nr:uncharacterized protein K489DRAFT_384230 [Dissoconium aciculare CBS 342.82]KAF1819311.1 hypothetical protein K489DRAFT_384230 [Dissoconium aciculare CBS 342.82]